MRTFPASALFGLALALAGITGAHAAGKTLKVCDDPDYLPYSNRAGEGFENAVAETVAKAMGARLEYVWDNQRAHGGYAEYLSRNLDSGKCDVVMSMPYGNEEELTTDPYYVSSYVFVFKKARNYSLENMNSPDLRKLKIGFESDTPVESGLQLRGMVQAATAFDVAETPGKSPRSMLQAVEDGTVDVMITWQPAIGAFLHDYPDLTTIALPNTRATGSPEMYSFPMSMAVRKNDEALRNALNQVIKQQQAALTGVLHQHGIQIFGDGDGSASPSHQMANL
jgi:mxaJ protein